MSSYKQHRKPYQELWFHESMDHFYIIGHHHRSATIIEGGDFRITATNIHQKDRDAQAEDRKALVIDRHTEQMSLITDQAKITTLFESSSLTTPPGRRIAGIFGIIQLITNKYLILISDTVQVGAICGEPVYRIERLEFVPYRRDSSPPPPPSSPLSPSDVALENKQDLDDGGRDATSYWLEQKKFNTEYLRMLTSLLTGPYFYLSYTYDLTRSLQSQYVAQQQQQSQQPTAPFGMLAYHNADQRFIWNRHVLRELSITIELEQFCLPIIYGFFACNTLSIDGSPSSSQSPLSNEFTSVTSNTFTHVLLSRRSTERAGTRLFCRGADARGHVANHVETEQIIFSTQQPQFVASFVQVRGSIPLRWTQLPNLRYKPPPGLVPSTNPNTATTDASSSSSLIDHQQSFAAHVCTFLRRFNPAAHYDSLTMINLINHHGQEAILLRKLHEVYNEHTQALALDRSVLSLESFDFHRECGQTRWDRLSLLLEQIGYDIDRNAYFMLSTSGPTVNVQLQTGIFRTNCIDSLDRTNVVQSLLAKKILQRQLQQIGFLPLGGTSGGTGGGGTDDDLLEQHSTLWNCYRNVWADNADALSIQYAGTPALKTDYTRTGRRTIRGALTDGLNSMIRYYKNNFTDGARQDSIDLLLGNYVVHPEEGARGGMRCPLANRNILKIFTFPFFILFSLLMFAFCSLLLPGSSDRWVDEKLFYLLFWFAMSSVCALWMITHGNEFVDMPTLVASGFGGGGGDSKRGKSKMI